MGQKYHMSSVSIARRAGSCAIPPGSFHEGGELGCALSHAFGAAIDNPGLVVASVVGDGDAETGPSRRILALLRPRVRA
jgi:xylulose-5-phosphate/fructose-6-phosphate phosphoketolase